MAGVMAAYLVGEKVLPLVDKQVLDKVAMMAEVMVAYSTAESTLIFFWSIAVKSAIVKPVGNSVY